MSEITVFEMLAPEAQAEVIDLAEDLGWDLEDAAIEYLRVGRSMATVRSLEQLRRKAPVLELAGRKEALKGSRGNQNEPSKQKD